MAIRYYANAPATTLTASCSNVATSISVASTSGLPIQYPYILILDRGTASEEVVLVTAAVSTTLTVTRGYDGTTAFAHAEEATAEHGISAIDPREANEHVNASAGVHGLAGSVVGTTDAQTVTNKDLSSGTNTFPSSLATDAEVASAVSAHAALTATHGATGAVVGTTNSQTLTNKTISADSNTISGLAASSFALTNGSGNLDGSASAKAVPTGTVVGTTDAQTLTNKTLTSPTISDPTITATSGWDSYTPVLKNWTLGNGTLTGRYKQIGKIVHYSISFTFGSTSVASGNLGITLPSSPAVAVSGFPVGWVQMWDTSGGVRQIWTAVWDTAADALQPRSVVYDAATGAFPWPSWGNGDQVLVNGTYEAA